MALRGSRRCRSDRVTGATYAPCGPAPSERVKGDPNGIAQTDVKTGHRPTRLRSADAAPMLCSVKRAMASPRSVTALLTDWSRGDSAALDQLLPLVYAELRRIAARQLRGERANHTLQPTALVHEVYVRLVDQREVDWHSRAHFLGVVARVMRRILVDHARRHGALKRGDGAQCVPLDEVTDVAAAGDVPVLALDLALERLGTIDPDLARIVELRAFGGLTIDEAAHVLKVSPSTAKREWRTAKAWLNRQLAAGSQA
jgi:RNA polymerase sigma factor (TIGR02999 family)